MSRLEDLKVLYTKAPTDYRTRMFQNIIPPCRILNLLTIEDIMSLNSIAKSKKLSAKPIEKLNMIKNIMGRRGFKRLSSGTNRVVFKYLEDQSFVIKVAYDSVGLSDNLNELYNQNLIRPFCTKVFDVSPCGTVGMFERVRAIRNREEFSSIAGDVYDIIVNEFVGKYVLADIGTKFFMNWGIRQNIFPVILDFPYIYELDGAKIYCNRPDPYSKYGFCGGDIDYDDGFNHLVCKKCGKTFLASELKLAAEKKSTDLIIDQEELNMIVEVKIGDKVISKTDSSNETSVYRKDKKRKRKETPYEYRTRRKEQSYNSLRVEISTTTTDVQDTSKESVTEKIRNQINPDQFNHGWESKSIPSIDNLYKDTRLEITNTEEERNKKEDIKREEEKPKEESVSLVDDEDNNDSVIEDENKDINEEDTADTGYSNQDINSDTGYPESDEDPYARVKEVLTIVMDDEDVDDTSEEDILSDY